MLLKSMLMFIFGIYPLISAIDGTITVLKYLPPTLPRDTVVLHFQTIYDTYFPELIPITDSITMFTYNNRLLSDAKLNVVNKQSSFMDCSAGPSGETEETFFCINKEDWTLVTRDYNPDKNLRHSMQLLMELQAKTSSESDDLTKRVYTIYIEINEPCSSLANLYEELVKTCNPAIPPLQRSGFTPNGKDVTFKIPPNYRNSFLVFTGARGSFNTMTSSTLYVSILDEQNTELVSKNIVSESKKNKYVSFDDVITNSGGKHYIIKFTTEKTTSQSSPSSVNAPADIVLEYYVLNELCSNKICLSLYYNWEYLVGKLTQQQQSCNNDTRRLESKFKKCSGLSNLNQIAATSTKQQYVLGDELTLLCSSSAMLLPHKFYIEKSGSTGYELVSASDTYTRITAYADYAYYRCRMNTFDDKYVIYSDPLQIKLQDVFKARLVFLLLNVPYTDDYKRSVSPAYAQLRDDLKRDINGEINRMYSSNVNPDFFVLSYSNVSGKVSVHASLSMTKTTDQIKAKLYKDWTEEIRTGISNDITGKTKPSDVKVFTFETCPYKQTASRNGLYQFQWKSLALGEIGQQECPDGNNKAYITCSTEQMIGYGALNNFNDSQCSYSITNSLEDIAKKQVTSENANEISRQLKQMSDNSSSYSTYDVVLTVNVLENLVNFLKESSETEENVFDSLDNVLDVSQSVMVYSQLANSTSSRFLNVLSKTGGMISENTPRVVNKRNYALGGWKLDKSNTDQVSVETTSLLNKQNILKFSKGTSEMKDKTNAILTLPASMFTTLGSVISSFNVISMVYGDDKLFTSNNGSSKINSADKVKSYILSTEIQGQTVKNLSNPITMTFKIIDGNYSRFIPSCVYWNRNKTKWMSDGLGLLSRNNTANTATCQSTHLTNFAVLFNAKIPEDDIHQDILTVMTYVGLSISLAGAFMTLVTYLVFPMLRESIPPKLLINLCVAIICMGIVFLVGVERDGKTKAACQSVAFLLQYFFLTIFCWSGVEGFHSARGLVFPMKVEIGRFVLKACVFGWGAPLLITAIGFGVWNEDYGDEQSCFVHSTVFYVTMTPPCLIMLFNVVALASILKSIYGEHNSFKSRKKGVMNRLKAIVGFSTIFSLTWISGIPLMITRHVAFQYVFCILCTLQGFYIFVIFCLRNPKASCVVRQKPFFVTVLVPAIFIFCSNMVALIAILCSLQGSTRKYSAHSLKPKERFRIIAVFVVLFGLTWIFGVLVISNDIIAFQYIFCIFSSLQGLYIFILYCVRNKKVRVYWTALLEGNSISDIRRSPTTKLQKKRAFTTDTSVSESQNYSVASTPGLNRTKGQQWRK